MTTQPHAAHNAATQPTPSDPPTPEATPGAVAGTADISHVAADPAEQDAWATYWADPSEANRNDLVLRYLPLVKFVAGRLVAGMPASVDAGDLISEGVFGLTDAITKYDAERGTRFTTYASTRIRGAILDSMRIGDWVPRGVRAKQRNLDKATAALTHTLGRTPTDHEAAAAADLTLAELHDVRNKTTLVSGMEDDEVDATATGRFTAYLGDPTTRIALTHALAQLPERDQIILNLYFFDGLTLAEIGAILDVTESRVSQLRSRALRKLRPHLEDN